jgi:hypothetical protein
MPSVLFVMGNQGLELMPMVKELSCSITSQLANGSVAVKAMLIWKTLLACGTSNHDEKKKKYPLHWNSDGLQGRKETDERPSIDTLHTWEFDTHMIHASR